MGDGSALFFSVFKKCPVQRLTNKLLVWWFGKDWPKGYFYPFLSWRQLSNCAKTNIHLLSSTGGMPVFFVLFSISSDEGQNPFIKRVEYLCFLFSFYLNRPHPQAVAVQKNWFGTKLKMACKFRDFKKYQKYVFLSWKCLL